MSENKGLRWGCQKLTRKRKNKKKGKGWGRSSISGSKSNRQWMGSLNKVMSGVHMDVACILQDPGIIWCHLYTTRISQSVSIISSTGVGIIVPYINIHNKLTVSTHHLILFGTYQHLILKQSHQSLSLSSEWKKSNIRTSYSSRIHFSP